MDLGTTPVWKLYVASGAQLTKQQVGDPGLVMDCEFHSDKFCTIVVPPYTDQNRPVSIPRRTLTHPRPAEKEQHSVFESVTNFLQDHAATGTTTSHHPADPTHPVHPVPISPELWAPFGALIRAYPDVAERGAGQEVLVNEKGKAEKYTRLAPILSTYPEEAGAKASIGVYRATRKVGLERGKVFDVRLMERHPHTTQAFIPMNKGTVSWHSPRFAGEGEADISVGRERRITAPARRRLPCCCGQEWAK
jgi:allantoicase